MSFTCQECGEKLESANTKHTLNDCGKYHLKRAFEIFERQLNLTGIQKARRNVEYAFKVLTVLEKLLGASKSEETYCEGFGTEG